MNRSWSVLTVKSIDEDARVITGIASTPSTDRVGDIVEPKGARFTLPIPFLMDHGKHGSDDSIGHVIDVKVKSDGLHIRAQIEKDPALPYLDAAWAKIKKGLVRGLSIGFRGKETEPIKGGGIRFKLWEWLELSAVVIPANQDASIQTIKSLDVSHPSAASGAATPVYGIDLSSKSDVVTISRIDRFGNAHTYEQSPGATGKPPSLFPRNQMKTSVAEQIGNFEAERSHKSQRMEEIMQASIEENRVFTPEEETEHKDLEAGIESIDKQIVTMRKHEKLLLTATPVSGDDPDNASESRQHAGRPTSVTHSKRNQPPGTGFTRLAMAMMAGKGSESDTERYIQRNFRDTPEVGMAYKAAVAAGTTTDANWAAPLVNYTDLASEFIDLLRPVTILGRLTAVRRVPFNVRIAKLVSGATAQWVGQGLAKPVSALDFDSITMQFTKLATIVVLTEELVRFSSPSAEAAVRAEIVSAVAQAMDATFIDPSVAAVANVSPASITNGISAIGNPGTSVATLTAALTSALSGVATANVNISSGVWIMRPSTAVYLSTLRTTQDVLAFPGMGLAGGSLFGFPVIVSGNMPADTGSSSYIVFLVQDEIYVADDGTTRVDASREASLQMDSAPSAGAQALVSLWQNNLVGLKAERFANWARRRDAAVAVIQDVGF